MSKAYTLGTNPMLTNAPRNHSSGYFPYQRGSTCNPMLADTPDTTPHTHTSVMHDVHTSVITMRTERRTLKALFAYGTLAAIHYSNTRVRDMDSCFKIDTISILTAKRIHEFFVGIRNAGDVHSVSDSQIQTLFAQYVRETATSF